MKIRLLLPAAAIALAIASSSARAQSPAITDAQIEALRALCDKKREDLKDYDQKPEGATDAQRQMRSSKEKIEWITIHATLSNPRQSARNAAEEKALLDRMESGSKKVNKSHDELVQYGSIPYHILIGPSGTVYQGRDFRMRAGSNTVYADPAAWSGEKRHNPADGTMRVAPSGTAPGNTAGHLTIALIGTFQPKAKTHKTYPAIPLNEITEYAPSDEALASLVRVVAGALRANDLTPDRVLLHREVANSQCPGDFAYDAIRGSEKRPGGMGPVMKRIVEAWDALAKKSE